MHVCVYMCVYVCMYVYIYMCIYVKSTTRHLNLSYISILTNLLRTVKETKSVKTIYNWIN